jgi:hypothetical protein
LSHFVCGTSKDSIGQHIAGHWSKSADRQVLPPYSAIGYIREGKMIGEAIFVDYTGSNIEIHLQSQDKNCFNRRTIKYIYKYVFVQLGCNRLTARIKPDNKQLLSLLLRLGFEYEYRQIDYFGPRETPEDALVYRLTKEKALRWM